MPEPFRICDGIKLCLASASPRRKQALADLGLAFVSYLPAFQERSPRPDERPELYAAQNALGKALAARGKIEGRVCIIAADTVVCLDGRIMGKPADLAEARAMLSALNGRTHEVHTAVHIVFPDDQSAAFCEKSRVWFADWPAEVIAAYLASCSPLDKAGAYGIQDLNGFLVKRITGSYSNIVGLPLAPLVELLLRRSIIAPA